MRFRARVEVQLRPGIADPEGATIERALPALGFDGVAHVRAGPLLQLRGRRPRRGSGALDGDRAGRPPAGQPVIEQSRLELEAI